MSARCAARLTTDEAYKQSDQDFTVVPSPIWVNGKEVKSHVATIRHDTSVALGVGVVGNRYKIIQNKSLFNILAPVIDEMGAIYETGGVLKGGAVV